MGSPPWGGSRAWSGVEALGQARSVDIFAAHYAYPVMAVYERTGPVGVFPGQLWSVG